MPRDTKTDRDIESIEEVERTGIRRDFGGIGRTNDTKRETQKIP